MERTVLKVFHPISRFVIQFSQIIPMKIWEHWERTCNEFLSREGKKMKQKSRIFSRITLVNPPTQFSVRETEYNPPPRTLLLPNVDDP